MNPVALAQSFLMDIAAGMVTDDEMRARARLLAYELEPLRGAETSRDQEHFTGPWTDEGGDVASGAGTGHRTLLDALQEDAEEHEAEGRVLQAANARAAVENLRVLWEVELEVWAWIGEDEYGGKLGLKQGLVPAGMIALVSIDRHKLMRRDLVDQLQAQVNTHGKPVRLVRFVPAGEEVRIDRTTWECPHCDFPPSHNPTDVKYRFCGNCHHYCEEVSP